MASSQQCIVPAVRNATPSDAESIRSLMSKVQVRSLDDFNVEDFLVAQDEESNVVGCGQVKQLEAGWFELSTLCVDPSMQSNGIGTHLMERLLEKAKESDKAAGVLLICFSSKTPFYARFGFQEVFVDEESDDKDERNGSKNKNYIPEAMKRQVIESRNKLRDWLAENDETHPAFETFSNGKIVCMKLKLHAEPKSEEPERDGDLVETELSAPYNDFAVTIKECRCVLCGNMFLASSPEDCVAHMENCGAFQRVHPEGGKTNPNGVYPSTNPFDD